MLATLLAGGYLSYRLFESRTYQIRGLLKRMLLQRPASAPVSPTFRAD
jgi:hypothetical protein